MPIVFSTASAEHLPDLSLHKPHAPTNFPRVSWIKQVCRILSSPLNFFVYEFNVFATTDRELSPCCFLGNLLFAHQLRLSSESGVGARLFGRGSTRGGRVIIYFVMVNVNNCTSVASILNSQLFLRICVYYLAQL